MCRACHAKPRADGLLATDDPSAPPGNDARIACTCRWLVGHNPKTQRAAWVPVVCLGCLKRFHRPVDETHIADVLGNVYTIAQV